jgi:hypothetical protein
MSDFSFAELPGVDQALLVGNKERVIEIRTVDFDQYSRDSMAAHR